VQARDKPPHIAIESVQISKAVLDWRYAIQAHAHVRAALDEQVALVSVMHANNETGSVQPIERLSPYAHKHGALLHTDAAQAVGKVPVDVYALGVDLRKAPEAITPTQARKKGI